MAIMIGMCTCSIKETGYWETKQDVTFDNSLRPSI